MIIEDMGLYYRPYKNKTHNTEEGKGQLMGYGGLLALTNH